MQLPQRVVFFAGPVPNVPLPLFMMFIEPSREEFDDFYADSASDGLKAVHESYEGDSLAVLEPLTECGAALGLDVAVVTPELRDAVAERLVDLAEGASWAGVNRLELVPRASEWTQRFLDAQPWLNTKGFLTASVRGCLTGEADLSIDADAPGAPRILATWRPIPSDENKRSLDVLVLSFNPMPEWVATCMRAVCRHASAPAPARIEHGRRAHASNHDVMLLLAACELLVARSRGDPAAVSRIAVGHDTLELRLKTA